MNKADWRRHLLAARAQVGTTVGPPVADAARDLVNAPGLAGVLPATGEWVACYAGFGGEVSTDRLLGELAARELRVLLPAPGPKLDRLAWGEVTAQTCALPAARPGLPAQPPEPWLDGSALGRCQLVLVPALAVDRSGTRLGRGGGWYDRALAFAKPGALILAVVHPLEVLVRHALPREAHDHPVDGALTWRGVELFGAE